MQFFLRRRRVFSTLLQSAYSSLERGCLLYFSMLAAAVFVAVVSSIVGSLALALLSSL